MDPCQLCRGDLNLSSILPLLIPLDPSTIHIPLYLLLSLISSLSLFKRQNKHNTFITTHKPFLLPSLFFVLVVPPLTPQAQNTSSCCLDEEKGRHASLWPSENTKKKIKKKVGENTNAPNKQQATDSTHDRGNADTTLPSRGRRRRAMAGEDEDRPNPSTADNKSCPRISQLERRIKGGS